MRGTIESSKKKGIKRVKRRANRNIIQKQFVFLQFENFKEFFGREMNYELLEIKN